MTSISITFICHPYQSGPMSPGPERYKPFIDAVAHHSGLQVPFVVASLRDAAPKEGFILLGGIDAQTALDECSNERRAELASRLVPINAGRTRIFERLLEPLSLGAAIDNMSLMEWQNHPDRLGAEGLFGRREIGELVGASCLLFESARYCYLQSPTHHGLPHLLADYLKALAGFNEAREAAR